MNKPADKTQALNKGWWEANPMTYVAWDACQREPYSIDDFKKIEVDFLEGNPWLRDNWFAQNFSVSAVLDIGCGSGVASRLFAKSGAKSVVGVDITSRAVEISRRGACAEGIRNAQFLCEDAESLSLDDNFFDIVFSWGVLHHSANMEQAISEAVRVLKPGGKGLIMVYNKRSLRYVFKGLYWLLFKGKLLKGYDLQTVQKFYTDGYFHRHVTGAELRAILTNNGAFDVAIECTHMSKKYIPLAPSKIDNIFKNRLGWLLVATFSKSVKSLN